jgi:hypothetical protein
VARVRAVEAGDRCELCRRSLPAAWSARLRHLKEEHPAFARGLLLRLAAPLAFVGLLLVLSALGAPAWTAALPLAVGGALAAAGIALSRRARTASGARPGPALARTLREGGFRFVLLSAVLAALALLAARR